MKVPHLILYISDIECDRVVVPIHRKGHCLNTVPAICETKTRNTSNEKKRFEAPGLKAITTNRSCPMKQLLAHSGIPTRGGSRTLCGRRPRAPL